MQPFKILLKLPTRQRRIKFFDVLDRYRLMATDPANIRWVATCDEDDREMNTGGVRSLLQNMGVEVHYGPARTKIEACNADIPSDGWDILVLASDDMIPQVQGWDEIIREQMKVCFPDLDGILNFHDGHQGDRINTLPVMGVNWYRRWGYVYNPIYQTMYCDTELTEVSRMFGKEIYLDKVIIEHRHPYSGAIPMDDLYIRNNDSAFDSNIYRERKANGFYVNRVMINQPGRTGDILITLPIAKHYSDQNCLVYWLCPEEYHELFRNIDYAMPVTEPVKGARQIDLSFGFGGPLEPWWQQNKQNFESFTVAKYYQAGVNYQKRWDLKFRRNYGREQALYEKIEQKDYVLTHEGTHLGRFIDLQMPDKVEFMPVDDFNVFDWYKVIEQAKEIHCIDSALSNFIEAVPEFHDKQKYIYLSAREKHYYLKSIYKNNWIYE